MPSNQSVCWNQLPEIKPGHATEDGKSGIYWTNETAVIKGDASLPKGKEIQLEQKSRLY